MCYVRVVRFGAAGALSGSSWGAGLPRENGLWEIRGRDHRSWSVEEEGEEGGLSWSVWLVGVAVAKANSELRCEVRASLRQGLGTKLSLVWFFFQQGQEVDTV